jgi:hypothetical protein
MHSLWRDSAGQVLWLVAALELGRLGYIGTAGAELNDASSLGQVAWWTALNLFLVWRVWRRGAIARGLLLFLTAGPILIAVWFTTDPSWYIAGLLSYGIVQVFLLLSPAVRSHVRQPAYPLPTDVDPQASATSSA